jgi:hypothetical protein
MPSELRVVPVTGEDWVVYRAVETDDRAAETYLGSFKSSYELGLPPRRWSPEERFRIIHMGISCFATARQAERVAVRWSLGDYVAELHLPPDEGFSYARWGSRGHMTVWGDPVKLSETATDIVRIQE